MNYIQSTQLLKVDFPKMGGWTGWPTIYSLFVKANKQIIMSKIWQQNITRSREETGSMQDIKWSLIFFFHSTIKEFNVVVMSTYTAIKTSEIRKTSSTSFHKKYQLLVVVHMFACVWMGEDCGIIRINIS